MLCAWHWGIGRALDLVGTGAQQTGSGDVECWLEQWWALVESWLWAASSAHMTPLAFLDARSPCVPAPPAPAAQREPSGLMAAVQPPRGSGGIAAGNSTYKPVAAASSWRPSIFTALLVRRRKCHAAAAQRSSLGGADPYR